MQKNSSILIGRSFYSVNSFGDFASRAIGKVLKNAKMSGRAPMAAPKLADGELRNTSGGGPPLDHAVCILGFWA